MRRPPFDHCPPTSAPADLTLFRRAPRRPRRGRVALTVGSVAMGSALFVWQGAQERVGAADRIVETGRDPLERRSDGTYEWGSLLLEGTGWGGARADLKRTTRWQDDVIGVVGGRWDDQIDFGAAPGEGAEAIEITFPAPASDVVVTAGMMGANEGGSGRDEAGVWRGYDAAGRLVGEGELDPDESALGPRVKARGYGEYPFELDAGSPIVRLDLIAIDWDRSGSPARTANNTDFGLVRVEWTESADGPPPPTSTTTTVPETTMTTASAPTTTTSSTTLPPTTSTTTVPGITTTTFVPTPDPSSPAVRTVAGTALLDADGITLAGFSADGDPAASGGRRGGIGVAGGRYGFQIDYDAITGRSERLVVGFDEPASDVQIDLTMLEPSEWRGLPETGRWAARNAARDLVATGLVDGSVSRAVSIDASDVATVEFEATAYGHGVGVDRTSNNSDFAIASVTWTIGAPTVPPTTVRPTTTTTVEPTTPSTTASTTTTTASTTTTTVPTTSTPTVTSTPAPSTGRRVDVAATQIGATRGIDLVARSIDGSVVATSARRGGVGVDGGRYDFQIDHDAATGRSESLEVHFDDPVDDVAVTLTMLELDEWRGLQETGRWTAYGADGAVVGDGTIDPRAIGSTSSTSTFDLATSAPVSSVVLGATAYGHGAGTSRFDNNSDFALLAVAWTE